MPNNPLTPKKVKPTVEFQRGLKTLSKKYRHIKSDIQPVLDKLVAGETVGDQIQDIGYSVFKERVVNRDARKGQSHGYRIIYWIKSNDEVLLVAIYSKLDQSDISDEYIRRVIQSYLST